MKRITDKILSLAAKTSKKVAVKSCGATSYFGCHQPMEPKILRFKKSEKDN